MNIKSEKKMDKPKSFLLIEIEQNFNKRKKSCAQVLKSIKASLDRNPNFSNLLGSLSRERE